MTKSSSSSTTTTDMEFGGPLGVCSMMIGLPAVIYGLFIFCNDPKVGCPNWSMLPLFSAYNYYSHKAMIVVIGWFLFLVALWWLLPAPRVPGVKLPSGNKLMYKLNGFSSGIVSSIVLTLGHKFAVWDLVWIHDNYLELATAAIIFSVVMSIVLYVSARLRFSIPSPYLAKPGSSGIWIYDFFMGHELNPRIGNLDLKQFCELRPGHVSNSMWLLNIFQLIYVVDALWFERAILTTMDITTDGFGFMLVFGDLAWVPFTYSLQARYLVTFKAGKDLPIPVVVWIVIVKAVGMAIFRGANGQKNKFRTNPNDPAVKHLKTLPTERGTQLLISGWWGIARHVNYFGDW